MDRHSTIHRNREAWQNLARHGHRLARSVKPDELLDPLGKVDSMGWLGGDIRGWQVLCLAAGGGRHGPLYRAAGALVTVVDFSSEMLDLDRQVQSGTGLQYTLIESSMDDLPMLANDHFDLVIHPVSTCYLPNLNPVFKEVARVIKPGGLYVSQHKQPTSLQTSLATNQNHYWLEQTYYTEQPLAPEPSNQLIREPFTYEYIHTWEALIGGICQAGMVIENLIEPRHADLSAPPGTFGHRSAFVPPYVRIKARRLKTDLGPAEPTNRLIL